MIEFVVPLPPRPKLRHRMGIVDDGEKAVAVARKAARTRKDEKHFRQVAGLHAGGGPLSGPLVVELFFVMKPSKKNEAKAKRGILAHTTTPDVDNLVKLALDAMNGVLWEDDKQILEVRARKSYGANPQTQVRISRAAFSWVE